MDTGDITAMEMGGEGMAVRSVTPSGVSLDSPRHVLVPLDTSEDQLTYQKTMQRIIQRYIFDIQREAEVTEGKHWNGVWRGGGGGSREEVLCVW